MLMVTDRILGRLYLTTLNSAPTPNTTLIVNVFHAAPAVLLTNYNRKAVWVAMTYIRLMIHLLSRLHMNCVLILLNLQLQLLLLLLLQPKAQLQHLSQLKHPVLLRHLILLPPCNPLQTLIRIKPMMVQITRIQTTAGAQAQTTEVIQVEVLLLMEVMVVMVQ